MMSLINSNTDVEHNTIEQWHLLALAAKANADSNPVSYTHLTLPTICSV